MKRLRLNMLHDMSRRPLSLRLLYIVSLFWLKDMEGLFAYYSKLSTSVDPTDFGIASVLQTVYRVAQKTGPMWPILSNCKYSENSMTEFRENR